MTDSGESQHKSGTMPQWAQDIDNAGRKIWRRHRRDEDQKQGEYVTAMILNAICLYFVNQLPNWNFPFITPNFGIILWVINLSLVAQIVGNGFMLIYRAKWWRSAILMIINAIGLWATYTFYVIFPIDLSVFTGEWANTLLRIFLIIGIIFGVLAVIFHFVRFIYSLTIELID